MPVSLAGLGADSLAISGHKLGGPKGGGALLLRPGLDVAPLVAGGGQERGRRGGTEPLPAIAGLGAAAEARNPRSRAGLALLRDAMEAGCRGAVVAGGRGAAPANTTSLILPGHAAETQVIALDLAGVQVSAGAACSSGKVGPSHVLRAMGIEDGAIRVSLPWNAPREAAEHFIRAWSAMRDRLSAALLAGPDDRHDEPPEPPDLPRQPRHDAGRSAGAGGPCAPGGRRTSPIPARSSTPSAARRRRRSRPRRAQVAELIGADANEIILTSGATEANNLAIKGAARFAAAQGTDRRRVVTPVTEHKCVLESVRDLAAEGFEPVLLPVGPDGLLDPARLEAALAEAPTLLVSVMAVNNEIGVVQDLAAIGEIAKRHGALFHTDAAQAAGRIGLDVAEIRADLLSLSGHKVYGPKGIGALYVRRRPRVRLAPLFSGGGQERGLRSGTLPAPLVVASARPAASRRWRACWIPGASPGSAGASATRWRRRCRDCG
jgi:cysteine sulfinate desulfinase/cysteine desulfurase-like protein